MAPARGRRERGSLTVAASAGVLALLLGSLAAVDLGAVLLARARAQAAADASALAAAVHMQPVLGQEGDPADAAADLARRNGASLVRCECTLGGLEAAVEVEIRPRVRFAPRWLSRVVRAAATAVIDDDVPTYRANE